MFIADELDAATTLSTLATGGARLIALRSTGYNNVDLAAAVKLGLTMLRVPAYSPHAAAEHAVALMLTLNRNIHRAYNRVREGDFDLNGLIGFDMFGKTVGIVGTGKIGTGLARITAGFGCNLLGHDVYRNPACLELGLQYVDLGHLLRQSDIVSLHCPLTSETRHLIDARTIAEIKQGSMLINTARGALIDASAAIDALKSREHFWYLDIDVYEEEGPLRFEDLSSTIIPDDVFARPTKRCEHVPQRLGSGISDKRNVLICRYARPITRSADQRGAFCPTRRDRHAVSTMVSSREYSG